MDMIESKGGQYVFIGIMIFVMVVIVMVQFISPLKDEITTARDSDHLNCTSTTISTGTKMTCVVVDTTLFYFIGACIAVAGGYLIGKKIEYKVSPPSQ